MVKKKKRRDDVSSNLDRKWRRSIVPSASQTSDDNQSCIVRGGFRLFRRIQLSSSSDEFPIEPLVPRSAPRDVVRNNWPDRRSTPIKTAKQTGGKATFQLRKLSGFNVADRYIEETSVLCFAHINSSAWKCCPLQMIFFLSSCKRITRI